MQTRLDGNGEMLCSWMTTYPLLIGICECGNGTENTVHVSTIDLAVAAFMFGESCFHHSAAHSL